MCMLYSRTYRRCYYDYSDPARTQILSRQILYFVLSFFRVIFAHFARLWMLLQRRGGRTGLSVCKTRSNKTPSRFVVSSATCCLRPSLARRSITISRARFFLLFVQIPTIISLLFSFKPHAVVYTHKNNTTERNTHIYVVLKRVPLPFVQEYKVHKHTRSLSDLHKSPGS